jgi:hypothetical protein
MQCIIFYTVCFTLKVNIYIYTYIQTQNIQYYAEDTFSIINTHKRLHTNSKRRVVEANKIGALEE